jgi:hypothetical protein
MAKHVIPRLGRSANLLMRDERHAPNAMQTPSLKHSFEHIVTQASVISAEVTRSLDWYDSKLGKLSKPQELLELGALLSSVRRGRVMAEELVKGVPSPNQVPANAAESVAEITTSLFNFIESCNQREEAINSMALRYRNKNAV